MSFSDESRRREGRGCIIGATVGLLCLLGTCAGCHYSFNPYNQVKVTISGIPADTNFLCLVADKPGGPEVMLWSEHNEFVSYANPPDASYSDTLVLLRMRHSPKVRWVKSDRIGVLRRSTSQKWSLYWYNPPKSNLSDRSLLLGGGHWEANIQDADEVQPVPIDQVRAMGIQPYPVR